jgi:drug/metabolite transporter (DMT)-like permease
VAVLSILRRSLRPERGEAWRLAVLGSAGYGTESTFFFLALGRGTAAAVTLLFFTYPVWVTTISALLGRGLPGWVVGGALAAAVAGATLVVASGGGLDIAPAGIAFALGSSLTFALYLLGAETWASRTSPLVSAMWVSGSASVALALFSVLGGAERFPHGGDEWIRVASMGFLTAGAFGLLFVGLRRVGAVRTAIIAALEPVVASLMAALILHEPLRPGVVAGGILILVAAVTASVVRGRETGAVP